MSSNNNMDMKVETIPLVKSLQGWAPFTLSVVVIFGSWLYNAGQKNQEIAVLEQKTVKLEEKVDKLNDKVDQLSYDVHTYILKLETKKNVR